MAGNAGPFPWAVSTSPGGDAPSVPEQLAASGRTAIRLLAESMATFRQDLANIRAGEYREPWDMTTRNRQFSPGFVLRRSAGYVNAAVGTLQRRAAQRPDDVWLKSELYPDYYLNTWHYQKDGWMSAESAAAYDAQTETLFMGRQDAVQRHALLPLKEHFAGREASSLRILDAACGTGRFLTFVRDNFPGCAVTALDMSPFYLAEARAIHAEWERVRGGGSVRFLQAPVERIPAPDGHFDAVTNIYMFHELPPAARRACAAELARVLAPGGVLVFMDGTQLGDRPKLDKYTPAFTDFNEPNWPTHIRMDYGALFRSVGLVPWRKEQASSSKVLAFRKPEEAPSTAGGNINN